MQVSMLQSDSDAEHTAIAAPITGSIPYSLHSLLVNNPLTDTDRWLTRPFHCILCLQSVGNVGWTDWPELIHSRSASTRQLSVAANRIALTALAPVVRSLQRGVDKRSQSGGRTSSVCAVCTLLISPLRDSVQIIPLSPTKTRAEFNWVVRRAIKRSAATSIILYTQAGVTSESPDSSGYQEHFGSESVTSVGLNYNCSAKNRIAESRHKNGLYSHGMSNFGWTNQKQVCTLLYSTKEDTLKKVVTTLSVVSCLGVWVCVCVSAGVQLIAAWLGTPVRRWSFSIKHLFARRIGCALGWTQCRFSGLLYPVSLDRDWFNNDQF